MASRGRHNSHFDRLKRGSNLTGGDRLSGSDASRKFNDNNENIPTKKVYVAHFPYHYEAEDLSKIFCKYGNISEINIVKSDNDKRYGFVTYSAIEEATAARSELHNAPPLRLIVNYAKYRDNFLNSSFEEDGKQNRNKSMLNNQRFGQRSKSVGPNRNSSDNTTYNTCISCGDKAACKCSSCGAKYCSPKCQNEDWPNHMLQCVSKPGLISLESTESQDSIGTQQSQMRNSSRLLQPRERILFNSRSLNSGTNREPSVNELVREITNEYKMSNNVNAVNDCEGHKGYQTQSDIRKDATSKPDIQPAPEKSILPDLKVSQNNPSTEIIIVNSNSNQTCSIQNSISTEEKMMKNPMYVLLEKLKKANTPAPVIPKQPWEEAELLSENCFTSISVIHCYDDGSFNAILKEKEALSIDIMTKANNGEFKLEHLSDIKIGQLCLVHNQTLKYRGKVLSLSPYRIHLLDFGFEVNATEEDLYEAPDYFTDIPAQAMYLKAAPGGLLKRVITLFDYISVKPTGEVFNGASVVLLEDEKYAISAHEQKTKIQQKIPEESLSTYLENNEHKTCKENSRTQVWKKTVSLPDTYTKVYVTNVEGDDLHVNVLSKMLDIANPLLSNANNCAREPLNNVVPDVLCLAEYEGLLYRAVIRSIKPIKAYLLDFGNTVTLTDHEVYCAPDIQASSPGQAIHVRLAPGSTKKLKLEDEVLMKTIDKEGDVHIVQVEGDSIKHPSQTSIPKPKKHAIEYLSLKTKGFIVIQERPCSNKFCLYVNTPEINKLQEYIADEIERSITETNIIERPRIGDEVIVGVNNSFLRAKVLKTGDNNSYVSLIDIGNVVQTNKFYSVPASIKEYPHLSIIGTLQSISCNEKEFEEFLKKDKIEFLVITTDNHILLKCFFKSNTTINFVLELKPWEPLMEQVQHGQIYLEPLSKCQVYLTHFDNQESLFIRKTTAELDKLYEEDLQNIATYGINAKPLLTMPVVNELVLAKFTDGVFYKAIVKEVNGDDISVLYTAYGNIDVTKLSNIREISDDLKKKNLFIREVALAEVKKGPLTTSVASLMNGIINSDPAIEFTMKPGQFQDNHNLVYLLYPEGTSLNEKVSHLLTPVWHDIKNMPREKAEDTLLNQEVLMKTLIRIPDIPTGNDIELFILDTTNLILNVFFACVPDQDCLINMLIDVPAELKNYATSIDMPYNPRVDELCIAKFEEANGEFVWHRAYCLSHEGDSCYLASVDIGLMQYVEIRNIRRMSIDFIDIPGLSAMFFIQGLPDPPLTSKAVDVLKSVLKPCESTMKFSHVKKEQDGSYSVRLSKQLLDSVLAVS